MAAKTPTAIKNYTPAGVESRERYVAYAHLIGLTAADELSLAHKIEAGIRFQSFVRLQRAIQLTNTQLATLISITNRTLTRRKSKGRLTPSESDRLLRIARIFQLALSLFEGDQAAAQAWLETPNRALNLEAPLELAKTEVGAREVGNLIQRLEHGVFS